MLCDSCTVCKTQPSLQQKAGDIFILSYTTQERWAPCSLHYWARSRNGRVSRGGPSAPEVVWFLISPRCTAKDTWEEQATSDDTQQSCSEFIFHTKEKQHNLSFAAEWSLGEATVQSLQALQELPKKDNFWKRQLRTQGSVTPWVPCSLRPRPQPSHSHFFVKFPYPDLSM